MRRFKSPNREQLMLFPPNLNDWLAVNHPARFVVDFVDTLDLSPIYSEYEKGGGDGQPPYDPKMMIALLLYANMRGIYSSRRIEAAIDDEIGFRFIANALRPDHDTISEFRNRFSSFLKDVFISSALLALKARAADMKHVAIDGTKIRAKASRDQRKTNKELELEIKQISQTVTDYFHEFHKTDVAEDQRFGKEQNGYLLPKFLEDPETRKEWMTDELAMIEQMLAKESEKTDEDQVENDHDDDDKRPPTKKAIRRMNRRLKRLRAAKEALEAKEKKRKEADPTGRRERGDAQKRGSEYVPRINTSDPDARTMRFKDGFNDGYNCQIAVDSQSGIILASSVTQDANDVNQLDPVLSQIKENTHRFPNAVSADTGYFNIKQMEDDRFRDIEMYVAPRKPRENEGPNTKSAKIREKLATEIGKKMYSARKFIVEPVFGAMKHARKYREFITCGLRMTTAEWHLQCTTHNLLKLYKLWVLPS